MATYNFQALRTEPPYGKLKSKLLSIIDFALKGREKTFIRLSNKGSAY